MSRAERFQRIQALARRQGELRSELAFAVVSGQERLARFARYELARVLCAKRDLCRGHKVVAPSEVSGVPVGSDPVSEWFAVHGWAQ